MNNSTKPQESIVTGLLAFSKGMMDGEDGSKLIKQYQYALDNITPIDMIEMEKRQLDSGITPEIIKKHIEKVMNVIYENLRKFQWEKPSEGNPLYYFMQENRKLEDLLAQIKLAIISKDYNQVVNLFLIIKAINKHYIRKENILFPYLEKTWANYHPLKVMWSLHDDIRSKLKELWQLLKKEDDFTPEINKLIGDLFFLFYGMIMKEELVIFPVAMQTVDERSWSEMQTQSAELGYAFIAAPSISNLTNNHNIAKNLSDIFWKVETGELQASQLELLLNTLPLDITFVDENDEVRYFSRPNERFFPRSPAIIGRKVHNCHPPESVHIVENIIASFRDGSKDEAKFWLNIKGKFLLIRYYAMRNEDGIYRGVLEVGQDITEIRKLEGEMRLLDWE